MKLSATKYLSGLEVSLAACLPKMASLAVGQSQRHYFHRKRSGTPDTGILSSHSQNDECRARRSFQGKFGMGAKRTNARSGQPRWYQQSMPKTTERRATDGTLAGKSERDGSTERTHGSIRRYPNKQPRRNGHAQRIVHIIHHGICTGTHRISDDGRCPIRPARHVSCSSARKSNLHTRSNVFLERLVCWQSVTFKQEGIPCAS